MKTKLIASVVLGCATVALAAEPQNGTAASSNQSGGASGRPSASGANQPDPAQTASSLMRSSGGSLLRASLMAKADPGQAKASEVSFFAVPAPEPRTLKKHDLVTIIVREESDFKSEGTSDLKKTANIDAKIEQFIKLNLLAQALQNGVGATPPELKLTGNRNFKGEATVDRQDSFTTRVTAEVIDVKPNGTLVLQARTRIKTDEEEQLLILSGVCRAEDVTPDNTILSTQIFDKDVTKSHKGAVRDTTKRGWVPRLLDALNPF